MPKPSRSPANTPSLPTIATVLTLIDGWSDLKETRRRDLASALRILPQLEGRPASSVQLDRVHSLALLERASPEALGLAPSTFANRVSCVRYVLRRIGALAPTRVRTAKPTHPAWLALLAELPAGPEFGRLRAFVTYCADEQVNPEAVDQSTLEAYAERRALEHGGSKARDHARRVGVQWNLAAKKVPGWPVSRLGLRAQPLQYSLPFGEYPASLQEETEQYLNDIGAPREEDLFAGGDRAAPVKPSTVITRRCCLRRLLWGAVQNGMPIESLTSLRQVPTPAFIKAALGWHHRRAGGVNADLAQLAATVASIGNYLRLPDQEWAAIKPLLAKATPEARHEVTEHTAHLLDRLSAPECRLRLLHLPRHLMDQAKRIRDGQPDHAGRCRVAQPESAAWTAATAIAIEILLHAPLRLTNLQHLRVGIELRLANVSGSNRRGTICVDGSQVKNKRRQEVPLQPETIALVHEYLDAFRPALPGADSAWLFPGRGGSEQPRHKGAFGQAITEAIEQYVGVRVNPHAFRAFAGSLILENDPHAIDDVRSLLGHACFETSLIYYRRNSQREAAKRLSATLSRERSATKLGAKAHFLAPELRSRVRRTR